MKAFIYFCGLAGLFALPQCTKSNHLTTSDTVPAGYFPDKVGYQWVYKVTDSLKNITDTVRVTIVGTMTNPQIRKTFKIWQYKWPDRIDTAYEERKGDTIRFYMSAAKKLCGCYPLAPINKAWVITNVFILPFSERQKITDASLQPPSFANIHGFTSSFKTGITYEDMNGNIIVDSGFEVHEGAAIPNAISSINELMVPKIGMVQETLTEMSIVYLEHWELIINNFSVKGIKLNE